MSDSNYCNLEREVADGGVLGRQRLLQERLRKGKDRKSFVLVPGKDNPDSYVNGLVLLRGACKDDLDGYLQPDFRGVARPLTFKETLEARVNLYRNASSDNERMSLFNSWNATCTAIVYQGGSSKFKIVPVSSHLLDLESGFKDSFVGVDYDAPVFDNLEQLDSKSPLYNTFGLSKGAVLVHPAWLAAVEGDQDFLGEYVDVVFHELKERYDLDKGMGFYVVKSPKESQLRALLVPYFGNCSNAWLQHCGEYYARFVRVAQTLSEGGV